MEDSVSVKSNESVATSEEFDFVGDKPDNRKSPTLDIGEGGDMDSLKTTLTELLQETVMMDHHPSCKEQLRTSSKLGELEGDVADSGGGTKRIIGQSTFYSCAVEPGKDPLSMESPTEKQDPTKSSSDSMEDEEDVDQDCTIFSGVTYLGAAAINAPKSEGEIQRNMTILNEQSSELGIKVSVSVPCSSQGFVVLYDAILNSVISRYEIHRILFYARGSVETSEAGCFAFTWSHGETQESAIFQCHVFRCDIAEAVSRVSACFAKAFQRVPRSMSSSVTSCAMDMSGSIIALPDTTRTLMYVFEVNLEIKEDDGKGTFSTVAKDRNGFRLKTNVDKQLCLNIRQVSDNGPQLHIERCFGILVAAGRHVRHSDMQLLEMKEQVPPNNASPDRNCTSVSATWDPTESSFEQLNVETPKDLKQYMTVAVDLVIRGIQEPVRFQMETPVRIYAQNERNFWYFQKRALVQQFFLNLKEVVAGDLNDVYYEVLNMETSGELDRNLLNLNLNLSSLIQSPSITSIDTMTPKEEYNSDGDEPLLSGTGRVSKDCSEDVLESWADVLSRWKSTKQPPKQLTNLVRVGIPEALRGEVWQRLAGVEENTAMMENYRLLITKESSCENVIQRDIARTFPAHDFFKEAGGLGQDSLYRVSKAYAVYDSEVGYCQGLSFLAATLLLHMPEEQAFCVLIKLMYDYGLRDLYKDGFDNLYLRLYQLNRLMEEQMGSLWQHFAAHHIETHMFASQWFLTLFTARFPLYFVFHIIDIFLLQGIDTLFQIALALLMMCKKDLLQLDFEGILKYFRVSLPKKCRNEEAAKQLIKLACSIKVKKLKKYETDFMALKDGWEIINLDSEAAINAESEANEVGQLRLAVARYEEERKLMLDEIGQLKEMLKREVDQAERDKEDNLKVVANYRLVRQRLDVQLRAAKVELETLRNKTSGCANCGRFASERISPTESLEMGGEDNDNDSDNRKDETGAERIRELELELAQTKLAHVEAECKNQDLVHQLRATETELTSAKNSWPPWLSKTLSSIKEVANKKDFSNTFTYPANTQQHHHHQNSNNVHQTTAPSFISHINSLRRESMPTTKGTSDMIISNSNNAQPGGQRRESTAPIIKDSQSCSSLKTQN